MMKFCEVSMATPMLPIMRKAKSLVRKPPTSASPPKNSSAPISTTFSSGKGIPSAAKKEASIPVYWAFRNSLSAP
jgi:hypothetical protein